MIRRLLLVIATLGMIGAFAQTIRDIGRLAERGCSGWEAEARGNCEAFARYYTYTDTVIFAVFAVLLIAVLLFSYFQSTGK